MAQAKGTQKSAGQAGTGPLKGMATLGRHQGVQAGSCHVLTGSCLNGFLRGEPPQGTEAGGIRPRAGTPAQPTPATRRGPPLPRGQSLAMI